MTDSQDKFYLVQENVLPQVLRKTAMAKEMLKKGNARTINEAVQAVGISRGAFYKYRDFIFPFREASKGKIITVALILEHTSGVLSEVLKAIATARGNVLTINQGIPLQGVANASISFETANLHGDVDDLLLLLSRVPGVQKLEVVGHT
ncbi:MAG: ACT domain-containing protein [Clostridiales bacterium]|jgi:chorismate mutase|nr:ACT domain-containing protein [Clostridiales bacterium]